MKKITTAITLLASLGLIGFANANQVSPYAYAYSVYGDNLVAGATLTNVTADTPNTAFSLPQGGLPAALSKDNKNAGLVTFYSTDKNQKDIKISLTYSVDAGVSPQTCVVTVESTNIFDKGQPLNAQLTTPICGVLFHPKYGTNTKDGDQVVTTNWKVE
ncbi:MULTISPECIES: hypothetical protein [Cysteiniphilum]|uniref:hypothetical protein n=1 Tax=Cysteiniphilum TaxID=2056696 RepID=UPI001780727F|nr:MULTISPECIES: hypothetical protein [Cysteiniphilum]